MSGVDPQFVGQRNSYEDGELRRSDLRADPFDQLRAWLDDAVAAEVLEPTAMALATVDADGVPDVRTLLARQITANSIVFFTNYDSVKAQQLAAHPVAAATMGWLPLQRQVRFRGDVRTASPQYCDEYFAGRPRASRIGAWASPQSTPIADRAELEMLVAEAEQRFEGTDVPRPAHWGGYELVPTWFEFWQGRSSRLHDRLTYQMTGEGVWQIQRLAP